MVGGVAGGLCAGDPVSAPHLGGVGWLDSAPVRHFADQFGLDVASLAFGLLGAAIVILAGVAWRKARAPAAK